MRPIQLDCTRHSAVYVCARPDCQARDVVRTRGAALVAAAHHYEIAHPELGKAADQLRRRAAQLRDTPTS